MGLPGSVPCPVIADGRHRANLASDRCVILPRAPARRCGRPTRTAGANAGTGPSGYTVALWEPMTTQSNMVVNGRVVARSESRAPKGWPSRRRDTDGRSSRCRCSNRARPLCNGLALAGVAASKMTAKTDRLSLVIVALQRLLGIARARRACPQLDWGDQLASRVTKTFRPTAGR